MSTKRVLNSPFFVLPLPDKWWRTSGIAAGSYSASGLMDTQFIKSNPDYHSEFVDPEFDNQQILN
jgi:hypothetical protein